MNLKQIAHEEGLRVIALSLAVQAYKIAARRRKPPRTRQTLVQVNVHVAGPPSATALRGSGFRCSAKCAYSVPLEYVASS